MSLPRELKATIHGKPILLTMKMVEAFSGVSDKGLYQDADGKEYVIKIPKKRDAQQIFKEAAPELINTPDAPKVITHIKELRDIQAFHEVLLPILTVKLFGDFYVVPRNVIYMEECGTFIISKKIKNFDEFLSSCALACQRKSSSDVKSITHMPMREELKLTPIQANVLGKLYFLGLLTGNLDLFNNVNMTNSGLVRTKDGQIKPANLDPANTLRQGFGGLSIDENAFQYFLKIRRYEFHPDGKFDIHAFVDSLMGFEGCVPFDKIVYPILPRQLVRDLFNMHGDDEVSKAMLAGFEEACHLALNKVDSMPSLYEDAMHEALENVYCGDAKADQYFQKILQGDFFFPTEKQISEGLPGILVARIYSLLDMLQNVKEGKTAEHIAEERWKQLLQSQQYEAMHFFHHRQLAPTCNDLTEVKSPRKS